MSNYKRISLYDSETKKVTTVVIRLRDFKNMEDLEIYAKKLREQQKIKNQNFKDQKYETSISKLMNTDFQPNPVDVIIEKKIFDNLDNFVLTKESGNTCVIFGSSQTGKTTLMTKTIYPQYYENNKEFITTLFSGNPQIDAYKNYKTLLIGDGFYAKSERYIKMHKVINMKTNNHYRFLELFDDILEMKYSRILNNLILSYRNSNISSVICLQYIKLLSKQNRANVNNIILFRSHTEEAIKDIIDTYLKQYFRKIGLQTYPEMYHFYIEATKDYGFIYICTKLNRVTFHRLKY